MNVARGRRVSTRCFLPVVVIPLLAQLTAVTPSRGAEPPPGVWRAFANPVASAGDASSLQSWPDGVTSAGHRAGIQSARFPTPRLSPTADEALAQGRVSADTGSPCPAALAERSAGLATLIKPAAAAEPAGYAAELRTTALGWPRLEHWCVWLEPLSDAADPSQRRWQEGVSASLAAWGRLLPLVRVDDPAAAQVRLLRRRPPLGLDASGRSRASRGRALLSLVAVERRPGDWRLEPAVAVLIDPGQRFEALQATALHELGHAFGLWGHSGDPADALARAAGPRPVLQPSARDRATLEWLQRQLTPFGGPWPLPP